MDFKIKCLFTIQTIDQSLSNHSTLKHLFIQSQEHIKTIIHSLEKWGK
jgi:hypothetical protein